MKIEARDGTAQRVRDEVVVEGQAPGLEGLDRRHEADQVHRQVVGEHEHDVGAVTAGRPPRSAPARPRSGRAAARRVGVRVVVAAMRRGGAADGGRDHRRHEDGDGQHRSDQPPVAAATRARWPGAWRRARGPAPPLAGRSRPRSVDRP